MTQKTELQTIVLFDIDSASLGGASFSYDVQQGRCVREFTNQRIDVPYVKDMPVDRFFAYTQREFQNLAETILKQTPSDISAIYINVGTPWLSSQKRILRYHRKNAFTVSDELLQKIREKEQGEPFSKNIDYVDHHHDLILLEQEITDIFLNGYSVRHPLGKEGTELVMHSLVSVMSDTSAQAFLHTIERVFHREAKLLSNNGVLYHNIIEQIPHENSSVVLDIGGRVTQVLVIHDDHLSDVASFPVGYHHIAHDIADAYDISVNKAESLMQSFLNKRFEGAYQKTLEEVMYQAYSRWKKAWFDMSRELSKQQRLPNIVCMSAPRTIARWLEFFILSDEEFSLMMKQGSVNLINLADLVADYHEGGLNESVAGDDSLVPLLYRVESLHAQSQKIV